MTAATQSTWTIFFLINDLDSVGGSSQLFCTIAIEVQRAGHRVSVYTDHPPSSDNRYVSQLQHAGISVNAGVAGDAGDRRQMHAFSPVRFAAALSRHTGGNVQRMARRLERLLIHRRFTHRCKLAFLAAAQESRREGSRALVHVHRGAHGIRWAHAARLPAVYVENSTPMPNAHIDWWFAPKPSSESHAARGWRRLRRVAPWIDLLIAGSERAAHGVRDVIGYSGPIATLPWMVPLAADGGAPRSEPTDAFVLGTAGRLEAEKGHSFLIEALPRLVQSNDVRLVVAGDGSLHSALQGLATQLGVRDRIEFCGAQDDAGMERFWDRIDLLVLPSLREGSPLVALEAMARRIPVLATDVGGVRELLDGGSCGRVVEARSAAALADGILEMIADPARRQRLAQAGYERFMSIHAPSSAAPRWLATYQSVLEHSAWSRG